LKLNAKPLIKSEQKPRKFQSLVEKRKLVNGFINLSTLNEPSLDRSFPLSM
jgi:hypothetical protein